MPRADARRRRGFAATLLAFALLAGCTTSEPDGRTVAPPLDVEKVVPGDEDAGDDGTAAEPDPEPPSPEPEPAPEPPPPPAGRDELIAQASRALVAATGEAESGELAVLVVDEHGREIVAHAADDAVLPASTLKVVTAAAVLVTLGPQHRIVTMLESTAPIDADGRIDGDVVLIGGGDPVLVTPEYARWVYPARPRTPLDDLAEQLEDAGVTRIEGDIHVVAPGFDGPRVASGWPDRYFSAFDARYSDGLTVDAGLQTLVSYPDLDELERDDPNGDEDPDAEDAPPDLDEIADALETGDLAAAEAALGPPNVRVDHASDPPLQTASALVRLLEQRGIEVVGTTVEGAPDAPIVGRLAVLESPPLIDLLRFAVQRSDNHLTDALFRLVGRARTGTGSFETGERALQQVLDHLGVVHEAAVFADGSGLSRDDRVTARLLVELDRAMTASRHGPAWLSLMASMGESGTLDRRLRGTVAQGRFVGKTGTLQDVTALSGAVVDDDGARYHLAVIANDAGMTRAVARSLADELILLLVADLDGCPVERPGDDDGVIGLPALVVRC